MIGMPPQQKYSQRQVNVHEDDMSSSSSEDDEVDGSSPGNAEGYSEATSSSY
jgi:hypothetical protein